jgi:hypothetical protein
VTGATTAGGTGAGWVDLVDLPIANADELTGTQIYIPTGGGSAQTRTVVSLLNASPVGVPSGSRVYPDRVFSPVPSTNATFEFWHRIGPDVVNEFISDAVRSVSTRILRHKEDTSLALTTDVYVYNLPTGFAYISEVWFEDAGTDDIYTVRLPYGYWHIDASASPRTIEFDKYSIANLFINARKIKIIGQQYASVPASDTAILEVDPEYVRAAAAVMVIDSLPYDEASRSRRDRFDNYAQRYLETAQTFPYPDSVEVEAF